MLRLAEHSEDTHKTLERFTKTQQRSLSTQINAVAMKLKSQVTVTVNTVREEYEVEDNHEELRCVE